MRRLALILSVALALPASAQTGETEEGLDLMGEAMRLFMRGLMREMEPALDDLQDLMGQLDAYHSPEVLPNGDIIIRRKLPPETDPEVGEDGDVEL